MDAVDASAAMVARAVVTHGVAVRCATFDDLGADDRYDGVWANFSLLHAIRDAVPRHLDAAHATLGAGDPMYVSLKSGEGTARDGLGQQRGTST